MSSIIKTRIQGFRICTFRNQDVHKYYGHLQSVMRSIDNSGNISNFLQNQKLMLLLLELQKLNGVVQATQRQGIFLSFLIRSNKLLKAM